MSYQKNPPWQKNVQQPIANFQQMNLGIGYNHPAFQMHPANQIPMNLPIQYQAAQPSANARGLNTIAFQPPTVSSQNTSQATSNQSKYNANLKVFSGTGIVSKVQNDIGFIDDEVLFHKNVCVKGMSPKLGDRVLVEAAYNQNMPFKWNATRVQVLPRTNSSSTANTESKSYETSDTYRSRRYSPDRRSERRGRSKDNRETDEENDRKRRRDDRERPRQRESMEIRDRTKSPQRRSSPKRRRGHATPRYMVQIPKISLSLANLDVFEVKRRYPNLYIPSDFASQENQWMNVFPMHQPFSIQKPCSFYIMKDVNPVDESVAGCNLDPSDADYTWSAKVMLLSLPSISEIYKKCIVRAEDSDKYDESDFTHPSRLISFLVGMRGKNETMAIGGPWSAKLDGENPESDPSVLIRTAIRTCKGLTGIDLSKCTQWYRFVELKYRRSDQNKKDAGDSGGIIKPARIENVVIFLPDVHSCMPNRSEWEGVQQQYKQALEKILSPDIDFKNEGEAAEVVTNGNKADQTDSKEADSGVVQDDIEMKAAMMTTNDANPNEEIPIDGGEVKEQKCDEQQVDPKNMKVTELRAELATRNLSTKGLKNELVERLEKALTGTTEIADNKEAESNEKPEEMQVDGEETVQEENSGTAQKDQDMEMNIAEMDMSEVTVIDEYDSTKCDEQEEKPEKKKTEPKKMDEKERSMWEKRYTLPATPQIVVHPSKTARNGKFDCAIVSLSLLLDYRKDDTKEHSFEIALFAEAFNEMLMRDFGFNIYKAFNVFSNKTKEDEKKKENAENTNKEKSSDATDQQDDSKDKGKSRKSSANDRRYDESDEKSNGKFVTAYPDLLLSFNYFDQTQCGYIFEKDIEELFYCLGVNMSRSQARKLTEKFITRDSLYYRKITDQPADAPVMNPFENITGEQIELLAYGNRAAKSASNDAIVQSNEIVTFEGTTVNLRQVMYQMKRIESAYEESEKLLVDLKKNNSDLKSTNHKNEKRIKDLNSDLKSMSRKLQDTESSLNSITRKYNECFSTIQSISERIAPVIARNERSRKSDKNSEKSTDKTEKKEKSKEDVKASTSEMKTEKAVKTEKKESVKEEQTSTAGDKEKAEEKDVKIDKNEKTADE